MAEQGNLTVIGSVASGPNLWRRATSCLWQPVRPRHGRGATATRAHIFFFQDLSAELVAIAGLY